MSDKFSLGALAHQVKFKISGVQGQEITILESLNVLAHVLRTPRKLHSLSDEKPLIEKDKDGLFIIERFEESKTISISISGYIQTEQAFARKFPFSLREGGLSFEFSPPQNEKLSQNLLTVIRGYRFFAIQPTEALELAFMPASYAYAFHKENNRMKEEIDLPMVLELLSEPSTCSLSSNSAKILAREIKNLQEAKVILEDKLREEKMFLENKLQKIEADFLCQSNKMDSYANKMDEMMNCIRELQSNLAQEETQKSEFENQLFQSNYTIESMTQEIQQLKFNNEQLQSTIKHHEEIQASTLKKMKQTAPVNASANINCRRRPL